MCCPEVNMGLTTCMIEHRNPWEISINKTVQD